MRKGIRCSAMQLGGVAHARIARDCGRCLMLSTDQGMEESELGRMFEGIPARSARTRLEAYRDLILRWRREGRTYREIQRILRERCDLKAAYGPLYRFVQRQSRPRKVQPEPEPITIGLPVQAKPPVASGATGRPLGR